MEGVLNWRVFAYIDYINTYYIAHKKRVDTKNSLHEYNIGYNIIICFWGYEYAV